MNMIIISFVVALLFSKLSIWAVREIHNREKLTPYECGFSPIRKLNSPFSVRFFLLALLFLVLELEIVYLFPWMWTYGSEFQYFEQFITLLIFILVLCLALGYEWSAGGLEWE